MGKCLSCFKKSSNTNKPSDTHSLTPEKEEEPTMYDGYSRGRPYLDCNGSFFTPSVVTNNLLRSWNAPDALKPDVESLSPEERAKQAKKWAEAGKAEHASIASFALFAQKLLAVGAPAHLVTEALQCAQEEISHASFAFTIASAFAGHNLTPSDYEAHTVTVTPDLLQIIEDTIREGCVEETVAALIACRELEEEKDNAIRQALTQVVEDEAHHAAFAWKVVKWAIEREDTTDKKIISLVESIITPTELKKIGNYTEEDIILLCNFKNMLLEQYRGEKSKREDVPYCGADVEANTVSQRVLQIVC